MLSFEESKRLEELKHQFAKAVGAIGHKFSDVELRGIFTEIEKIQKEDRNEAAWQAAIKLKTPIREFGIFEALDISDIDYIQQQILDLLNKK